MQGGEIAISGSYEDFLTQSGKSLLRLATALAGNSTDGQDLLQSTLLKTMSAWSRIEVTNRYAYVRRALVNENVNMWRRKSARPEYLTDLEDTISLLDPADSVAMRDALERALTQLTNSQRTAIVLRYVEGMSIAETADHMGCEESTVKSHCFRGLEALRSSKHLRIVTVEVLDA